MTEQPTPNGPAAPRPVPDLGFFAGPAQRSGSPFGGAPVAAPPSSPAAGSRFEGDAGNQFGSALAPVFGAPASPVYAAPSLQRKTTSSFAGLPLGRIGAGLLVLVVLGAFGLGRLPGLMAIFQGDLTAPTSLGGVPRMTVAGTSEQELEAERALEAENTGDAVVAMYGGPEPMFTLVAQRGKIDIDRELTEIGAAGKGYAAGESTCATSATGVTLCLRTSRTLSVMVISLVGAEPVAAALDEAWETL